MGRIAPYQIFCGWTGGLRDSGRPGPARRGEWPAVPPATPPVAAARQYYPGTSLDPCNNGHLTGCMVPRQPIQHRLSLSITGPSRPQCQYAFKHGIPDRQRAAQ